MGDLVIPAGLEFSAAFELLAVGLAVGIIVAVLAALTRIRG